MAQVTASETEPRLAASLVRPLIRALVDAGCDYEAVLDECGLAALDLKDEAKRLPHSQALRLLDAAATASGDPCFHLRCAARLDAVDLGFFATLLATAPTVGDAIARVQRYGRLLHDRCHQWAEQRDDLYYWFTELQGVPSAALLAECLAAATVGRLRLRMGPTWAPQQVWFRHAPQASDDAYARAFGCGVRYGAPHNGLVMDAAILALPNADPGVLSALVERHADTLLSQLAEASRFSDRVRDELGRALPTADLSAGAIARRLHVSRATLGRRLSVEGTSLSRVLEELRRDLAIGYLRNPEMSLEELAQRLAFSDARAFRRAFVRWTGRTPAQHRHTSMQPSRERSSSKTRRLAPGKS